LLGGALGTSKLSLEEAVAALLPNAGLDLASIDRVSRSRVKLLFRIGNDPSRYWPLEARVDVAADASTEAVDDALYDEIVRGLSRWRQEHAADSGTTAPGSTGP
jgi:hypothetical protein